MGWNGFTVMTLPLGATTDATTDEWQTRKWHSSMTRLRCRHPRTPNNSREHRWKKQPSVVLLTTTIPAAVPTSPPSLYNYRVVDLADLVNSRLPTHCPRVRVRGSNTRHDRSLDPTSSVVIFVNAGNPTALSISTFVISSASS